MKLRLQLDRGTTDPVDVALTCDSTATVHDVAEFLAVADPATPEGAVPPADLTLSLGGARGRGLDPSLPIVDSGLLSGQRVSLTRAGDQFVAERSAPAAVLRVVAGPDAGRDHPLHTGSNVVGRGRGCQVRLSDPMVSRQHVRLNVSDVVEVADLGSANGMAVNDAPAVREHLRTGDRVSVGDTDFVVRLLRNEAAEGRAEGSAVPFIRSPRLVKIFPGDKFEAPEPPERPRPDHFPLAMVLVPLLMGAVLFAVTQTWITVIFIMMMPLMMIAHWLETRASGRRDHREALRLFRFDIATLRHDVGQANQREIMSRRLENPSAGECVAAASDRSPLLWSRRTDSPGWAELRVGTGTVPHRSVIEMPSAKKAPRELFNELGAALEPVREVHDVPVIVQPAQEGGVGVAGPRPVAAALARALVVQAAALHSPEELAIGVVASARTAPDWDWLKWLPHTDGPRSPVDVPHLAATDGGATQLVSALTELAAGRATDKNLRSVAIKTPVFVLVVEHDAPVEFARLTELAEKGWQQGVHVVWVAPEVAQLPAACRTFVDVTDAPSGDVGYLRTGDLVAPVRLETVEADAAASFARGLAPVEDITGLSEDSSDLPRSTAWLNLVGTGLGDEPSFVVERWLENRSVFSGPYAPAVLPRKPAQLRATLGVNAGGLHQLDLRADGPHALVGGTTGSGKSELLQTWILGMAASNSPERLTFLLVDYKGGSAFAECNDLPHTVGLVTDLNSNGVRRALTSLAAELRHREEVLHRYAAKDLVTLEKTHPAAAPPSLVIIVDEFAALVQEVPDFVDGVVNVAQRGRSLGLHLILATQRPAGVIKGNLLANTNLRVALRVADIDDSTDVLGIPNAAYFDQDTPGRAISKTGPGRFITFQTGYVGGHTGQVVAAPDIAVRELGFSRSVPWERPFSADEPLDEPGTHDLGPNDIARIVDTITAAHERAELPAPRKPWLPDLLPHYALGSLPSRRRDDALVFGIADDADAQAQPTIAFHPDVEGNMAVFGASGSGKSTLLRTLAIAAGYTVRGGPCHVYGLDFGSRGLAMLEDLPHVGSIIVGSDEERVQRLVTWLRDVCEDRAARFAAVNASTITEYRRLADAPEEPRILVLLDNVGAMRNAYEVSSNAWVFDTLIQVAGDGRPLGVHLLVTADRLNSVPTALAAAIQSRVVLRMADVNDYGFVGVPHDILTPDSPPGRGIYADREIQVALLGDSPDVVAQAEAARGFRVSMERAGVTPAPAIRRLPEQVWFGELPAEEDGRPVLGVRSDDLGTWTFEPTGSFIVSGPPGSGRTTAVRSLVRALRRRDPAWRTVLLTGRRVGLAQGENWTHAAVGTEKVEEMATQLMDDLRELEASGAGSPLKLVLVLEAVDELANSDAESTLSELVALALANDVFVVSEGEVSALGGSYGLMAAVKVSRRGLALQPDSGDGQLVYRTDFPMRARSSQFPAGRGFLVALGRTELGQVAVPD
ncbi:FtsK/SpoIIIE domain-containing protein [Propioniciclava soli]|uniref:FtsK/SpoIIIE domain-containing protein n=1 Tax=Propioniciclava soli TaxID=2775081 RepID=UPI001E42DD9E